MRAASTFRIVLLFVALSVCLSLAPVGAMGQDVGVEVGGGAGIFRPKNPEAKKRTTGKPTTPATPTTKRGGAARAVAPTPAANEDRIEDLLDKGNQFRDARRFAEAESAYQGILKIKPRDGRAAYGLGNIYSDQQR